MSDLKHTQRGFAYIEFFDHYDNKCSLQKSSIASQDAIWLGVDDANPQVMARDAATLGVKTNETTGWVPYPLPAAVSLTTRMHLTQDQVRELLPTLIHFAETGDVVAPADCHTAPPVQQDAVDALNDNDREKLVSAIMQLDRLATGTIESLGSDNLLKPGNPKKATMADVKRITPYIVANLRAIVGKLDAAISTMKGEGNG